MWCGVVYWFSCKCVRPQCLVQCGDYLSVSDHWCSLQNNKLFCILYLCMQDTWIRGPSLFMEGGWRFMQIGWYDFYHPLYIECSRIYFTPNRHVHPQHCNLQFKLNFLICVTDQITKYKQHWHLDLWTTFDIFIQEIAISFDNIQSHLQT